jgi:ATP-binding cassette subfamily A (ABC1) protein 3
MDPKTRRILWDCLNKIRNKGKSLILTTHSMDETEALCSNIGIMVNGELKCLGSLQNLKSRYGEGYTLLSKIALIKNDREKQTKEINEFILFIKDNFSESNCKLKENRNGFINIHINDNTTTCLSKIFSLVEQNKSKYSIEYYVVTQTKLEQIFLNFASKQIDPETRMIINKRFLCC